MARQLRVQYPGALYHVVNRGDWREAIFRDDADRRRSLDTLGKACGKAGCQVLALCLMPMKLWTDPFPEKATFLHTLFNRPSGGY